MTTFRWYLLGILGLFSAYVVLEYNRPKELDWRPSYINKDKIPYGTFALFDQLPRLLGTDSVEQVRLPVYNHLTGTPVGESGVEEQDVDELSEEVPVDSVVVDTAAAEATIAAADTTTAEVSDGADSMTVVREEVSMPDEQHTAATLELPTRRANYLFVNEDFRVSDLEARLLLRFVAQGSDVFIAAEDFGDYNSFFRDTLGFVSFTMPPVLPKVGARAARTDSVTLRFLNPGLHGPRYRLPGGAAPRRLLVERGRHGATLATDEQGRAVLICLDYGQGHFYLCSVPKAFTNYFVLREPPAGFAAAALAYLPARRSWWDEYQKQGLAGEQTLLRVLLQHDALRAAYYLSLLGILLFVLIYVRRRQRIIPVIKPLPNTTLLFTRTVASLYRQGQNHTLIAQKQAALFLDFLRSRLPEASAEQLGDADFRERLAQKSGLPPARVAEALRQLQFARTSPSVSDRELLLLSRTLRDFRRAMS